MAMKNNDSHKEDKKISPTDVKTKQKLDFSKFTKYLSKERIEEVTTAKHIEKLNYKLYIHSELPGLKEDKNEKKIANQMRRFETAEAKKLFLLEQKTYQNEELFTMMYAPTKEKLDKKEHMEFRSARQAIYAGAGLLDPKTYARIKDVPADAQIKIDDANKELHAKYEEIHKKAHDEFIVKNPVRSEGELAAAKEVFVKSEKEYQSAYAAKKAELEAALATKVDAFKTKNDVELAKIKAKLEHEEVQMAAIIQKNVEIHGDYQLPDDVILRLENLSMHFGGLKAVDDLTVDIKTGEVFGLIGPNGAGKTTVFNCITQFYKPTLGNVWYKSGTGRVLLLNNYAVHNVIKLGIVRTFQNVEVIPELTIFQNLLIAAHTQYKTNLFAHMFTTSQVKREEEIIGKKAMRVLEYLDLVSIKDYPPIGLPYGILKRIELARTLMADARLIILDEPAAGLNDKESEDLAVLIKKIAKDFNVTIFLVEHDMGLVMDICDHICAISFGRKLSYGTPAEIQADPVVQEAYLGSE